LAASGFLAVLAGPALADGGCGHWSAQSVSAPTTSQDQVVQGEQSTPVSTQTASTDEKSD
jgi:hypothetical protein